MAVYRTRMDAGRFAEAWDGVADGLAFAFGADAYEMRPGDVVVAHEERVDGSTDRRSIAATAVLVAGGGGLTMVTCGPLVIRYDAAGVSAGMIDLTDRVNRSAACFLFRDDAFPEVEPGLVRHVAESSGGLAAVLLMQDWTPPDLGDVAPGDTVELVGDGFSILATVTRVGWPRAKLGPIVFAITPGAAIPEFAAIAPAESRMDAHPLDRIDLSGRVVHPVN